ncbi:hypothetical protein [Pseudoalteromonas sp. T1lg48]|nr:hypothetical protein [Pseudoalteromonas sp. T1lg48]
MLPTTHALDLGHYQEKQLKPIIDVLQSIGMTIDYGQLGKQFLLL